MEWRRRVELELLHCPKASPSLHALLRPPPPAASQYQKGNSTCKLHIYCGRKASSQLPAQVVPPAAQRVVAIQPAGACEVVRCGARGGCECSMRGSMKVRMAPAADGQLLSILPTHTKPVTHITPRQMHSMLQYKRTTAGRWHSRGSRWAAAALCTWRRRSGRQSSRHPPRPAVGVCIQRQLSSISRFACDAVPLNQASARHLHGPPPRPAAQLPPGRMKPKSVACHAPPLGRPPCSHASSGQCKPPSHTQEPAAHPEYAARISPHLCRPEQHAAAPHKLRALLHTRQRP